MGSCKTYGKLLPQQAPPPQHAHDLHSEDNLHLVQGLLHIRVNLATKDIPRLALSKSFFWSTHLSNLLLEQLGLPVDTSPQRST